MLKGVKVDKKDIKINITRFGDNTFLIFKNKIQNIIFVKDILRSFGVALVLKVNFTERNLESIEVQNIQIEKYVAILNSYH